MSDIQRYWPDIEGVGVLRAVMRPIPDDMHPDDEYVKYADHVAAVKAAEERWIHDSLEQGYANGKSHGLLEGYARGYEQGQRDAVSAPITDDNTYASVYGHGWTNGQADGYANALADAVAAVEALPIDEFVRLDPANAKATVIAAIKGVGHVESDT